MKGKTTMIVVICLICIILTAVMFLQFKTISRIDVTALENMQEEELRKEITSWKTKLADIEKELEGTFINIEEYRENVENNQKASELLENDLNKLQGIIGLREVSGSGIVVTLTDNENTKIMADDLIELVNELKLAGAEAISINDQRIVYDSYIVDIGGGFINVNGEKLVSPYEVKAIGNPTYLESSLSKKQYGYIDTKKAYGITVTLQRKDSISINKYEKNLNFDDKYIK